MNLRDYELLYDLPVGEYQGRGVEGVRTVTYRAGRSVEIMCHPILRGSAEARREARERRTSPAMQRINSRNRERNHMRIIEENFTERAQVATFTYAYPVEDYGMCDRRELTRIYDERRLPWEMERCRKDMRNFFDRLKRRTGKEIKWDMTIEEGKQLPAPGLPPKYHVHALIEGEGVDRGLIESLWTHGRVRCAALDLANDGAMRLARYFNKQKHEGRWWSHSRNLRIPQPTVSDRRMSRRRMMQIAADVQIEGRAILEALYPGYKVVELPDVRYSDFAPGCYIYARLRRRDAMEPWEREPRGKREKTSSDRLRRPPSPEGEGKDLIRQRFALPPSPEGKAF